MCVRTSQRTANSLLTEPGTILQHEFMVVACPVQIWERFQRVLVRQNPIKRISSNVDVTSRALTVSIGTLRNVLKTVVVQLSKETRVSSMVEVLGADLTLEHDGDMYLIQPTNCEQVQGSHLYMA